MKRFSVILLTLLSTLSLFGQGFNVQQPIKWECKYEKLDKDTYEVIVKGVITDTTWHIYDMETYEDGPNSTVLTVEGDKNVKLIGKPYLKSPVTKKFDPMFGVEIGICEKNVLAAQKINISGSGEVKVIVVIEWQACDDKTCLVPSEKEFLLKIPVK